MKKTLLAVGILSVLGSSAMADRWVTGKLVKLETWMNSTYYYLLENGESNPDCKVKFKPDSGMSTDSKKLLSAITLTAMSTTKDIQIYVIGSGECKTSETDTTYIAKGIKIVQ